MVRATRDWERPEKGARRMARPLLFDAMRRGG